MQGGSHGKKLKTVQLIALIFLTVSGGPYGLEPLISYVGGYQALLLLIITPILWDIPTVAAVLELNSMMPVQGGYYQWVKKALGLKWAFYEGWWTWLYTFVDLAIYPVLFVEYLSFFFPYINSFKIPICLCMIWLCSILNILGVVPVGKFAVYLSALVLIPFLLLIVMALTQNAFLAVPSFSLHRTSFSSIGMGLYTVMWNFIGWDNTTTYAEKVNRPIRSYIFSIIFAFLFILILYFLVVFVSQRIGINPQQLADKGYPSLGTMVAGKWLGALIALGGMASALGLYSAVLLSISRVPKVMADDGVLPQILNKLHPRFGTPYISIICSSMVVSIMILWTFMDLLVIDVTLYGAALLLEYISLLVLRVKEPNLNRPFKIPLGIGGLIMVIFAPLGVYLIAICSAFIGMGQTIKPLLFAFGCLLSAVIIWRIFHKQNNIG